jgi:hypothetical protein
MRYLFALIPIILGLSSCSSYQYMTLSSPQLTKNDKHQFVFENDTMRLTYDFNGSGGPVSIDIFNKTSQPLYVNWKKSALIRNERFLSYFDRRVEFYGSGGSVSYRIGRFTASNSSFAGTLTLPEGVDFIPPGSSVAKALVFLGETGPMVVEVPDSITQQKISDTYGTSLAKYRQRSFDEDGSPARFKSYLTFTLGMNNALEFAESNDFYVSEAVDSKAAPEKFPLYQQQGDKFFIKYQKQQ